MSKTIDFYFDVVSPAAYLAFTQLPALAQETGATLVYKPVLIGGIFQATNNHPPIAIPAKGAYMFKDLGRFARRYDVPFSMNRHFPVNTLTVMRMITGVQQRMPEQLVRLVDCLFRALWVDGLNAADAAVLTAVLQAAEFDAEALLALAADAEVKAALKTATDAAVARGIFGLPAMFVGDEMFWGQDRLGFVREAVLA